MQEEVKSGSGKKWFFGCCGGLVLFMFLIAGGGYFGAGWAKDKVATVLTEQIAVSLEKADLPEDQSSKINVQMQRFESAIKGWGVIEALKHMGNLDQVKGEVKAIGSHAALLGYAHYVLPHTDMPEEERTAGRRILRRFARGVDEGKVTLNHDDKSWELDAEKKDDEKVEFDVAKVRAHLVQLKAQVDAAEIPDEDYDVDLANRLETIVDAVLAD